MRVSADWARWGGCAIERGWRRRDRERARGAGVGDCRTRAYRPLGAELLVQHRQKIIPRRRPRVLALLLHRRLGFLGSHFGTTRFQRANAHALPLANAASARDYTPRVPTRDTSDARDETRASISATARFEVATGRFAVDFKDRRDFSRWSARLGKPARHRKFSHHNVTSQRATVTRFPLVSLEPSALFQALRVRYAARASILRDAPRGGRQRAARGPAARVIPHGDVRGRRRERRLLDAQPLGARRRHVRSFRRRATRGRARTARAGASSARYLLRARLGVRGGHLEHRLGGLRVRGLVVSCIAVVPVSAVEGGAGRASRWGG